MVMTQSGGTLPDGEAMLEHVMTVVLKQPKDDPLAKALDEGGILDIFGVLSLSPSDRDSLAYVGDGGTVKPISNGHKNLLGALKTFASHCWAEGSPIVNWTLVTKEDLMPSGAVEQICIPLKWMIPLLLLPCLSLFPRVLLLLVRCKVI